MKFRAAAVALALCASTFTQPANAGLNAEIDLSNPRIVPIYGDYRSSSPNPPNSGDQASYSGFLYSSRIVFSAAHSEVQFDREGNKTNFNAKYLFVGRPNSTAGDYKGLVKVEKRFIAKNYRFNEASLDDFAIYVLEKDLIPAAPVKLLTPEIEAEIRESKTPIKMHGYGEYKDRCEPNETMPCMQRYKKTLQPRTLTSVLYTLAEVEAMVGYKRPQLADHLIMNNGKTGFGCSGDSGGSITSTYKNEFIYLATTPNGNSVYACGASGGHDGKGGISYASPVYKHLDIIKEAEDYVAVALAREAEAKAALAKKKSTITCIKGKVSKNVTGTNPKCPPGYKKK
jgi:hypothetical protein